MRRGWESGQKDKMLGGENVIQITFLLVSLWVSALLSSGLSIFHAACQVPGVFGSFRFYSAASLYRQIAEQTYRKPALKQAERHRWAAH